VRVYLVDRMMLMPTDDAITRNMMSKLWPFHEFCRRCRRKTGKRPTASIEKTVKEKTCVMLERGDANTVDAINAAFVERLVGERGALPIWHTSYDVQI
jgi:hypothetical protein